MAKVHTYLIFCVGLMLLLKWFGIPTAIDSLLVFLGIADGVNNVTTSTFYVTITTIFAASAVGGIIIGFLTKTSPEVYIRAPLVAGLVIFVGTFISVINYANSNSPVWVAYLASAIFIPLIIGYLLALVEFWGGTG